MSMVDLLDPKSGLNVSTILSLIQRLPSEQRHLLYQQLGVSNEEGILTLLQPTGSLGTDTYEEELMQYSEYKARKTLILYIPPVLLFLGTFGNILSFIILMHRSMRRQSTYIYLAVLSITDTLVIYIGLLPIWIGELTGYNIRNQGNWTCKIINTVASTVSDYSVWLIIAVTVERYIAVCHPLKATTMCTRVRAIKVIMGLLALLLAINAHFLWTVETQLFKHGGEYIPQCVAARNFNMLVEYVWPWMDAFIYSFLPFAVLMVLNVLIIRQVIKARRRREEMRSAGSGGSDHRRIQPESGSKLTVMLLTISFAFLLMTLPMNVLLIATAFWNSYANDLKIVAQFKLTRTVTELLMYSNHSTNFFLYCATGQRFRQQLIQLICRRAGVISSGRNAVNSVYRGTRAFNNTDSELTLSQRSDKRKQPRGPNYVHLPRHNKENTISC